MQVLQSLDTSRYDFAFSGVQCRIQIEDFEKFADHQQQQRGIGNYQSCLLTYVDFDMNFLDLYIGMHPGYTFR